MGSDGSRGEKKEEERERVGQSLPFHLYWLAQRNITSGDAQTHTHAHTDRDTLPCTHSFIQTQSYTLVLYFVQSNLEPKP